MDKINDFRQIEGSDPNAIVEKNYRNIHNFTYEKYLQRILGKIFG
jgi:hypothetical protein